MTEVGDAPVPLARALSFLPDVRELDPLRRTLIGEVASAPVDEGRRPGVHPNAPRGELEPERVDAAIRSAEEELCEEARFLASTCRRLLHAAAANDTAAAIHELIALGDSAFEQSHFRKARAFFEAALAHALPLRAAGPRILAFQRIGRVAHRSADLAGALYHYRRSARLAADSDDGPSEIVAKTGAGNVLLSMGHWEAADAEYREGLHRHYRVPERGPHTEVGYIWANRAVVAKRRRRFRRGERYLSRAWQAHEAAGSSPDAFALCHQGLAEIRHHQGRSFEAISLCRKALEAAESLYHRASFTDDLAAYHLDVGLTADALRLSRMSEDLALASRVPYALIEMYRTRGNILRRMGDESGWVHFERALEIARRTGHRYAEAEVLLDYAPMREMIGDPEEAAAYREHALGLLRELGVVRIETAEGVVYVGVAAD